MSIIDNLPLTYLNDISKEIPLSKDDELELWKDYKINRNINARDKLIKSNLKFVALIAKRYIGMGLSYSELISEGNIGLIKAIDKFDATLGYKIITYSVWWIKQSILEALEKRNLIPSEEIINENIYDDVSSDDIFNKKTINYNDINHYLLNNTDEDEDRIYKKNIIKKLTSNLNKREKEIINNYYGLDGNKPHTLEDIGDNMGLTKERVRQINDKALKKIRSNALSHNITF